MKVFIVNGAPGAGKTTFELEFSKIYNNTMILSTIQPIKELAKKVGWDGKKTPEARKFLSDLKDITTYYNDYSFNWVMQVIHSVLIMEKVLKDDKENFKEKVVFVDCREPEEIEKFVKTLNELNVTVYTVLIQSDRTDNQPTSNHADQNVNNYNYDIYFDNNVTDDDMKTLREGITYFVNKCILKGDKE